MFRTPDAWWSAMAKRPQTEQEALQTDLRNAYISIHFDNDLGMRDRAALLHHLQGFLLEHPHFNGVIAEEVLGTPLGFHDARIGRFQFTNGPHISAPSGAFWQPPQVD